MSDYEKIKHPAHYGGADNPYEARKVIRAWKLGFNLGTAAKYICRAGKKPGEDALDDLRKAVFYLQDEIDGRAADRLPPREAAPTPDKQDEAQRWKLRAWAGEIMQFNGTVVDHVRVCEYRTHPAACVRVEYVDGRQGPGWVPPRCLTERAAPEAQPTEDYRVYVARDPDARKVEAWITDEVLDFARAEPRHEDEEFPELADRIAEGTRLPIGDVQAALRANGYDENANEQAFRGVRDRL